ncbi:MAG TPA: universal stress protein [Blastococcus sp.]|jgi:nucleotide-binding universal stress UspA family protein|nr:universal stress protein [Blastococcus sp.]
MSPTPAPDAREIVVGVDGSDCALGAVRWAAHEAVRRNAPLRIVHAADYLGHPDEAGTPSPELPRARRITAKAFTVARHTEHEVTASTEIVPGDAAAALLDAGAAAQLIVLGSSTTGAADEMVLAPVALRVGARSPQPVVVVPRPRGRSDAARPVVAVLGFGSAEDDEPVTLFAADAARAAGVPLLLLRLGAPRSGGAEEADDSAEWARRLPDVEVRGTDMPGASASQVLTAACPSPLVVLSAGQGSMLHRSLDGQHRWLLRHCTSPMALVPPAQRADLEEREEIVATG